MEHLITQIQLIFRNTLLRYFKVLTILFLTLHQNLDCRAQDVQEWKNKIAAGNSEEQLEASWELFKHYISTNRDSARLYAERSNFFAISLNDSLLIVKSYNALGFIHKENGNYTEAIANYKEALSIATIKDYTDQLKFLLNNLALSHMYRGDYDNSLDYHLRTLELKEKTNDKEGIALTYNNMGLVYYRIGDHEKALDYFSASLKIKRENNFRAGIENSLINVGLAYTGLEEYDRAISTYNEVFDICADSCNDHIALDAYMGMGFSYFKIGNFEKSETNFRKAIKIAKRINDPANLIISNLYLSKIKLRERKIDSAFLFVSKAESQSNQTDAKTWKMEIDNLYADLYEAQGDYQKAYFHENRYSTLKDSIFNEELIKNLANIQLEYQEAQTQEIIAGKDSQIKRRTQINLMLGGITLLISALLYILYRNVQLKKKANKKLAEANEIIEDQNKELTNVNAVLEDRVKERTKELKKTNEALKKSNEELDNFIYKTSHDIRGPLATLMGVCNIAQIDVKDDKALDYFDKLSLTATRLNEILSKLLTINQINNTALQPQKIYIAELVENLAAEQIMSYKNPKVEIDIDIADNLNLTSDLDLLRVIYGNLINNAIKFRDTSDRKDSFIKIVAYKNANSIGFEIIDNGIGINETETEKIFEVFSKATDIADSSGIGLYLVKLAVEKLSGTITFDQTDEGFTLFKVVLPA